MTHVDRIIEFLFNHKGQSMPPADVAKRLGLTSDQVHAAVKTAVKRGKVEKIPRGKGRSYLLKAKGKHVTFDQIVFNLRKCQHD